MEYNSGSNRASNFKSAERPAARGRFEINILFEFNILLLIQLIMRECTIYVNLFFLPLLKTSRTYLSELQTVGKQLLIEPSSVQMIDARAAKLSDYGYPITKSSNWTAVIGYPRDRATIT